MRNRSKIEQRHCLGIYVYSLINIGLGYLWASSNPEPIHLLLCMLAVSVLGSIFLIFIRS